MYAIILAAGRGSRLGLSLPKVLVELAFGIKMIDNHLSILGNYFERKHIILTTGFQSDGVRNSAKGCVFVENPEYETNNTAKSLELALKDCPSHDVLLINGDVLYNASAVKLMLAGAGNYIGVRRGAISDEEVKFTTDSNGYVKKLSKELMQGEGEAVGLNRFTAATCSEISAALTSCTDADYFEKAVETVLPHSKCRPIDLTDTGCIEIDFPEDLIKAKTLYLEHSNFRQRG